MTVETAIALGISPRELDAIADSEPSLYDALVAGAREKWTTTDELLAGIYELTHANYRVLLAIAGTKKSDLPEPAKVPRPDSRDRANMKKTKKTAASSTEFAGWISARRSGQ